MDEALSEYLAQLQKEGRNDSTGCFSLDLRRALEKLQEYRLPGPHHYVLNLVSAAVATGASWVDVDTSLACLTLTFDGRPFTLEELQHLYGRFFDSHRPRYRELVIGLRGGLGLRQRQILESWDCSAGLGVSLLHEPHQLQLYALRSPPFEDPRVVSRIQLRSAAMHLARHPELALLEARCQHSGVRLHRNGKLLAEPPPPTSLVLSARSERELPGLRPALGMRSPPAQTPAGVSLLVEIPQEPVTPSCEAVVLGVGFPTDRLRHFPCRLWVYAPELAKDLSQSGLVQNEAFEETFQSAESALWRLLVDSIPRHSEDLADRLRAVLLRALAAANPERRSPDGEPWEPAWTHPWLESAVAAAALSVERLDRQYREIGYLPVAQTRWGRWSSMAIVLEKPRLRSPLRALFPNVLHAW